MINSNENTQSNKPSFNERFQSITRLLESPKWVKSYQRLPRYFNWLFIILILYGLADLTWRLIPKPTLTEYKPVNQNVKVSAKQNLQLYSASQINKWALFGKPISKSSTPIVKKVIEIEEAQLNLTLKGITHSVHKHESFAIIVGTRGKQKNYKIGDVVPNIPGNPKIEQILKDAVILLHNNARVKLMLKKSKLAKPKRKNLGSVTKDPAIRINK